MVHNPQLRGCICAIGTGNFYTVCSGEMLDDNRLGLVRKR